MPVNITRINQKIAALQAKDVAAIMVSKPFISELGNGYTEEQLQAWLDSKVRILEWAKIRNAIEVTREILAIRDFLKDSDRTLADRLINRELNVNFDDITPEKRPLLAKIALLIFAMD